MENELWQQYGRSRSVVDRENIINYYLLFAKKIALSLYRMWQGTEVLAEDFVQYATVGLIEAVDGYRPESGVQFKYYAKFRIKGAIFNAISTYSENMDYSSHRRTVEKERQASIRQLMDSSGGPQFNQVYDLVVNYAVTLLLEDEVVESDGAYDEYRPYRDPEEFSLRSQLLSFIDKLPDRNRLVLQLHYIEGLSFTETANFLNLSKASVSLAHSKGILLLREMYREADPIDKII